MQHSSLSCSIFHCGVHLLRNSLVLNGKLKGVKNGIVQMLAELYLMVFTEYLEYHIVDIKRNLINNTYLAHMDRFLNKSSVISLHMLE